MKITITGATGFVGTNLQKYLKATHQVSALSLRYKKNQEFELNVDAIIHLAGKAHDLKKVSQPQDYYDANFELTKQLFDAFLKSKATIFVFMSSVKASADEVQGILTEQEKPNPKTHYGISKLQAEQYILSKELPEGKRVYILRPCMIHGEGNKGNLNLLYKVITKGIPWPLGAFENKRSFLSVENLFFVINELLQNEHIASGVYNVADDESISTNDLIKLIGSSLGRKIYIWKVPISVVKALVKIGDFLKLPLNSERLAKLTENYEVNNQKIKLALHKNMPLGAKEGLLKTLNSFN
ncbi:MAG: NAD-dependent epimerase/dehydratase family protein [Sphingobacteriaceae bacterium]|nr:NAD-dependent epimerase/dehydratase family protein [Sphingobacteriaceae bacterium]